MESSGLLRFLGETQHCIPFVKVSFEIYGFYPKIKYFNLF